VLLRVCTKNCGLPSFCSVCRLQEEWLHVAQPRLFRCPASASVSCGSQASPCMPTAFCTNCTVKTMVSVMRSVCWSLCCLLFMQSETRHLVCQTSSALQTVGSMFWKFSLFCTDMMDEMGRRGLLTETDSEPKPKRRGKKAQTDSAQMFKNVLSMKSTKTSAQTLIQCAIYASLKAIETLQVSGHNSSQVWILTTTSVASQMCRFTFLFVV